MKGIKSRKGAKGKKAVNQPRILVVDDDPAILELISTLLQDKGYEVQVANGGLASERVVNSGFLPDVVIMDMVMPDQDGITTLRRLHEVHPEVKVIMLSCVTATRKVVEAMKYGAHEYLSKPFAPAELEALVEECVVRVRQRRDDPMLPLPCIVEEMDGMSFIGATPQIHALYEQIKMVAKTDLSVLVLGESGTGKEVVARLIHKLSGRSRKTFLKVNCAAVPGELMESELFGYEPGAFTGAVGHKPGKFELCNQGTIMLDEIGEMPVGLQVKLLQVLQDGTFERLGGRKTVHVDVRLLAATNVDVPQALANGAFRQDLYYRLNACTLQVPPLRERVDDIPLLLKHYVGVFSELYSCPAEPLTPALVQACREFSWPGNVRELCSFVKRWLMLRDEEAMIRDLEEQTASLPERIPVRQVASEAPMPAFNPRMGS